MWKAATDESPRTLEPAGSSIVDVDRARLAEQAETARPGRLDHQAVGGLLDAGLLGVAHVQVTGVVGGPDLDDGVGAVGGDDTDVADRQFDGDGDRLGGGEGGHDGIS